jgi:hypothetical protein
VNRQTLKLARSLKVVIVNVKTLSVHLPTSSKLGWKVSHQTNWESVLNPPASLADIKPQNPRFAFCAMLYAQ